MNKTELIHIAKQPFYIELPAYDILKQYLDEIKKHYDDQEIIDDIERSIAEKLTEALNTIDSVIEIKEIDWNIFDLRVKIENQFYTKVSANPDKYYFVTPKEANLVVSPLDLPPISASILLGCA